MDRRHRTEYEKGVITMENTRIGFAMCGSICTFAAALEQAKLLAEEGFDILPIMSENAYSTDTRFGTAQSCIDTLQELSGKDIVHTIVQAEPIGPKNLADVLVVAPCTSNTLAKIANGVNDTAVTMAVKSQLRNGKPVVLALSTNDALAAAARNIGQLMNQRNLYLVPLHQDDPAAKPRSMTAELTQLLPTIGAALDGKQIQPMVF